MIYTPHIMRSITTTTRNTDMNKRSQYLDVIDDWTKVIVVEHPTNVSPSTTGQIQREGKQMKQFRRGMMVVRQDEWETQRQKNQEAQQRVTTTGQQRGYFRQAIQQRRRFQRGMMVITPLEN